MWCSRRMKEISLVERVKMNYYTAKAETNTRHTIKRRKANWIGHTCFLKHITEGKTEGTGGRGRRQSR